MKRKKSKNPFKGVGVGLGTRSIREFPETHVQPLREKTLMPSKLDLPKPSIDLKKGLAICDSTGNDYTEADMQKLHATMERQIVRQLLPVPDVCISITLGGDRHVGLTELGNELVFIQRHGKADAHLDQYVNTRYRTKAEVRRLIEYIQDLLIHFPEE